MLGLAVTRWVLVPTSARYWLERGGRLHLGTQMLVVHCRFMKGRFARLSFRSKIFFQPFDIFLNFHTPFVWLLLLRFFKYICLSTHLRKIQVPSLLQSDINDCNFWMQTSNLFGGFWLDSNVLILLFSSLSLVLASGSKLWVDARLNELESQAWSFGLSVVMIDYLLPPLGSNPLHHPQNQPLQKQFEPVIRLTFPPLSDWFYVLMIPGG